MITLQTSNNFGRWLKTLMNRNGISTRILADKSGVSAKDVRNWIRGKALPKTAYFVFLLRALSKLVDVDECILYENAAEEILRDS
jgi:transcriptional regulator with XRE-family HTH domain